MENYQEKARENFYRNRPYGIHIDYARKGFVQEKARENFYRNRPYGIHIDYARKGFVLFNHYTNSLGK